jgi:hypothetical protein
MTFKSPFNVRSPVFFVELFQAGHIYDDFGFRRVAAGVIFLGSADDKINDVGKAAATTTTFAHGMINFGRNDKLPAVFIEELDDSVADFLVGDVIATAN